MFDALSIYLVSFDLLTSNSSSVSKLFGHSEHFFDLESGSGGAPEILFSLKSRPESEFKLFLTRVTSYTEFFDRNNLNSSEFEVLEEVSGVIDDADGV